MIPNLSEMIPGGGGGGGSFLNVPAVTGPEKLFFVFAFFKTKDINTYEIQTIKISRNVAEFTGFSD